MNRAHPTRLSFAQTSPNPALATAAHQKTGDGLLSQLHRHASGNDANPNPCGHTETCRHVYYSQSSIKFATPVRRNFDAPAIGTSPVRCSDLGLILSRLNAEHCCLMIERHGSSKGRKTGETGTGLRPKSGLRLVPLVPRHRATDAENSAGWLPARKPRIFPWDSHGFFRCTQNVRRSPATEMLRVTAINSA